MLTFILSLSFTNQGIRTIKDAAKRVKGARDLAKKLGVEVKQVYLTSGESDIVVIVDTANGDNVAKYVLALGARGNVRTRTARAWSEAEYLKMVSELP
ncbi:MAG: GYD domain-containing protein [Alphaproteobacteria bacterium]